MGAYLVMVIPFTLSRIVGGEKRRTETSYPIFTCARFTGHVPAVHAFTQAHGRD